MYIQDEAANYGILQGVAAGYACEFRKMKGIYAAVVQVKNAGNIASIHAAERNSDSWQVYITKVSNKINYNTAENKYEQS